MTRVLKGLAVLIAAATCLVLSLHLTAFRPTAQAGKTFALTGATILVGPELTSVPNGTIMVSEGRIAAVGRAADIVVPSGVETINLCGHTVLPGLIDMHVHLGGAGARSALTDIPFRLFDGGRDVAATRRALLAHGVTTVRSLGDAYPWIVELRDRIAAGELEGPRILAAGPVFTTQNGHPIASHGASPDGDGIRLPNSPEKARDMVRALATGNAAVDLIKVIQERGGPRMALAALPPAVLSAIVDEAHAHGLPVIAHYGTLDDLRDVLAAGVDGVEHLERRAVADGWPQDLLDTLIAADIPLDPTLTVTSVAIPEEAHAVLRVRLAEYLARDGRIVAGTDSGMPGVGFGAGLHQELELLVASGLDPIAALSAATVDAADALRMAEIGVIEAGRVADLLVVQGAPHRDIAAIRNVAQVYRDGRRVYVVD